MYAKNVDEWLVITLKNSETTSTKVHGNTMSLEKNLGDGCKATVTTFGTDLPHVALHAQLLFTTICIIISLFHSRSFRMKRILVIFG